MVARKKLLLSKENTAQVCKTESEKYKQTHNTTTTPPQVEITHITQCAMFVKKQT